MSRLRAMFAVLRGRGVIYNVDETFRLQLKVPPGDVQLPDVLGRSRLTVLAEPGSRFIDRQGQEWIVNGHEGLHVTAKGTTASTENERPDRASREDL